MSDGSKGYEVTESLLRKYPEMNVVYCENDNEAFGAIEAIEAAGRKVGSDISNGEIMILSFDGVKLQALEDVMNDSISCIGECNPLHGPRVEAIIQTLERGEIPQKYEYVDEVIYSAFEEINGVIVDSKEYPVTIVNQELLDLKATRSDQGDYTDQSINVY